MYLNHLHHFRGVAICGIVGAHSLHNFTWAEDSVVFRAADTTFNQSSCWFFFIAGFLFQYLSPKYRTLKYYRSKFLNVILPYLVMSIPALVVFTAFMPQGDVPDGFYDRPLLEQIGLFLVSGKHLAPFWFVPTITLIYLAAPLLLAMDRRIWPYWILLGLIPLSAWLGRDGLLAINGWSPFFSPVSKALYLLAVYLFGMWLGRFHDRLLEVMPKLWMPLLALGALGFYGHFSWYYPAQAEYHAGLRPLESLPFQWMLLFKLATSPLIVYALFLGDRFMPRGLHFLGSLSFGLFFVHGFVLGGFKIVLPRLGIGDAEGRIEGNLLVYVLFALVVLAISTGVLVVAKRIFGKRSRMVVGC